MQILLAWQSQRLSSVDALQHWQNILHTWKLRYQQIVAQELNSATSHSGSLFLGLIYLPRMFRAWQEFYENDTHTVAWSGLAHNLMDIIHSQSHTHLNQNFLYHLEASGDSFLRQLEGRFIVSVLNRKTATLRIITNPQGLTPCFHTEGEYGFAIGTRIAPLLDLVKRPCEPNRAAMLQVFAMDWCLNHETTFKGVFQIEAGNDACLSHHVFRLKKRSYWNPQYILNPEESCASAQNLMLGSDAVNATINSQMRHSTSPLLDITGGMDSRAIAVSVASLGYRPDGNVSGVQNSQEVRLASTVAEILELNLHKILPGPYYAENMADNLRQWSLWTEGMIPTHISFAQSAFSLCAELRKFYAAYQQTFCGAGGETGRSMYYRNEVLIQEFPPEKIIAQIMQKIRIRFRESFLHEQEFDPIEHEVRQTIHEGRIFGLNGYKLMDYYYWRQRASRWAGFMLDMQQLGRHVFAPLCQSRLITTFFAMTKEEHLTAAWHRYHIRRQCPQLSMLPFQKSWPLSGMHQFIYNLHPSIFAIAWHLNPGKLFSRRKLPRSDPQKLGSYFHPYLYDLLFSGHEWWPNVIRYENGQKAWENFVFGVEVQPLWNLVTIELWARNFL